MLGRVMTFLYGILCYLIFCATFLYAVAFLGDFGFVKSIDSGPDTGIGQALAINAALLALFAVQHSVMARQWFKQAWASLVPPPVERSTYVLFSSLAMILLFWLWRPMGGEIWEVDAPAARNAIWGVYALGWVILLAATFLINHFDLFGLRQVYLHLIGRPYTGLEFRTPGFYRYVRHPLYVGWLCIFWATPSMTTAHLVFAIATTAYILLAIRWEENDLIRIHGERYRVYREQVPKLIPLRLRKKPQGEAVAMGD
ncbi:MAG: isoprenylcysteine carboxylmethyltransferase family protein [Bryobacteraceae bacterium]